MPGKISKKNARETTKVPMEKQKKTIFMGNKKLHGGKHTPIPLSPVALPLPPCVSLFPLNLSPPPTADPLTFTTHPSPIFRLTSWLLTPNHYAVHTIAQYLDFSPPLPLPIAFQTPSSILSPRTLMCCNIPLHHPTLLPSCNHHPPRFHPLPHSSHRLKLPHHNPHNPLLSSPIRRCCLATFVALRHHFSVLATLAAHHLVVLVVSAPCRYAAPPELCRPSSRRPRRFCSPSLCRSTRHQLHFCFRCPRCPHSLTASSFLPDRVRAIRTVV